MGVRRKVVGKSEGKRSLGELRHGWEENKRKGDILLWTRFSGSGWGPVAGFCVVNAVMNLQVSGMAENYLTS